MELDNEAILALATCLHSEKQPSLSSDCLDVLLTLSTDSLKVFYSHDCRVLHALLRHLSLCQQHFPKLKENLQRSLIILVNVSGQSKKLSEIIVKAMWQFDKTLGLLIDVHKFPSTVALHCAQLFANLTHQCSDVLAEIWNADYEDSFSQIYKLWTSADDDFALVHDYYGFVLMNLSTVSKIRNYFSQFHLEQILPLLAPGVRRQRRRCAFSIAYNIAYDAVLHKRLLFVGGSDDQSASDVDEDAFLVALLTPLADADDHMDTDEIEKLPMFLQYYEGKRETDEFILRKSVESLYQLCATKLGRERLRAKGVYALLRELDRWHTARHNGFQMNDVTNDSGRMIGDFPTNTRASDNVVNVVEGEFKNVLHSLIGVLIRYEDEMGVTGDPFFSLKDLNIGENSDS